MADQHFSDFPEISDVEDTDEYALSRAGESYKIKGESLKSELLQIRKVTEYISKAEVLDMHNNPIQIVSAPGSNRAIVPIQCVVHVVFGGQPFGQSNNTLRLRASHLYTEND